MKHDGKTNVLIVDNNERVLMTIERLLENEGFNTVSTWSGHEALSLLRSGAFDVLLVDDYLPDLHAHDFLTRVGTLPIQPWVVVMQPSAPTSAEFQRYQWLGASSVVSKRDPRAVRDAVHQCCTDEPLTLIN
jgi:two-component system, OmpR family, response regulator